MRLQICQCQMKQCVMALNSAQKFINLLTHLSPAGEAEHFHSQWPLQQMNNNEGFKTSTLNRRSRVPPEGSSWAQKALAVSEKERTRRKENGGKKRVMLMLNHIRYIFIRSARLEQTQKFQPPH